VLGLAIIDGWKAFGHRAEGPRLARMQRSPHWKDGHFANPEPLVNHFWDMLAGLLDASSHTSPSSPLPAVRIDPSGFATPLATGLRVTWLGHAALLVELDGYRVLTDPVWSSRASPFTWIGPTRWYTPTIALSDVPKLDAVVISHDHYDHLDYRTVTALSARGVPFVVPLGVGAHLAYWGVPERQIIELDWWQRARFGALEIVCTPARHASGRHLFDKDDKLWAGYALVGPTRRVYFSGDTGLFPAMREIGARLGPFDLTAIEVGQYHRAWPDWHLGPEQAVLAHQMVRGKVMLPMHWGLFTLAYHGWTEPAERVLAAARRANVTLIVPKPGQSLEPDAAPPLSRWWPSLPWQTATEHPIVSTSIR
jgi:L-ascorbate metabolism protein UlaG (beta-lactamase superfamily)